MKWIKLMQRMKTLGGAKMDRKELLLKLCQKVYDRVDYLYGESSGLRAHTGESLMWFGSVFSKIGWILLWGEEQEREQMFKVIEETLQREHMLKCSWEEWLYFKLLDLEDEIDKRLFPQEEEEHQPNHTTPETEPETDELPF
jgi:hypothetical protein